MQMTLSPDAAAPVQGPISRRPRWLAWAAIALLALVLAACDSVEERAENHYQSGMALLAEGDPVKATLEFRNALKLNDSHVGANMELGRIFEENANAPGAVHQYQKVVSLDATQYEAHLKLGQLLLSSNQIEAAAVHIANAAQLRPEIADVLILEATLAMRTGNEALARERAEAVLAQDENLGDAWVILSALSRRADQSEKALEQINEGQRRDPDNVRVLLFRLNLLGEMQALDEIGPALQRLITLQPDEISFHDALVRWQLRTGRYEEAEETLRRLSELAPADTVRALDIVRLIARTEGREAAIAELARLIELRKGSAVEQMLTLSMAEIEIEDRQLDSAATRLNALIDTVGEDETGITARNLLARIKLTQDDRLSTQTLVNQVLAVDPTNATALMLRGRLQILKEEYDAAIRDLRAAEAEAPDSVEVLQLLALAHQRNGSSDLAGERLAAAVEISEYGVPQVLSYAQFLLRQRKSDFAENLVAEALSRRPGTIQLIDALARIKLQNRDFAGVETIALGLQAQPDTAEVGDRLMAAALAGQERYEETIGILEQAGNESGRTNAYLSALVATHLRNDDLPAAEALVEEALADDTNNTDALRLKATLTLVRGEADAAGALFEQAIEQDPKSAANHLAMSRYHLQTGDGQAAADALNKGIILSDASVLYLNRAMVREQLGDIEGAIEDYQLLYEREPGSELIANNLASLITDSAPTPDQIERAYQIARRLRDTDVPQFKDTYGWILYLRGDLPGARREISQAAEALPTNPIVQYHLGLVLADSGDAEGARTALTRAIELAGERAIPQIADAQAKLDGLATTAQ
ncbi:MAG: tetratricopeptide repeat protein [Pseudomonadota bacterium]